jgi:uncharacterized protein (DUF488 family)
MTAMPHQGVLTIGHSNHPIWRFIELLQVHEVSMVIDVRSVPYSRRFPDFSRESLGRSLAAQGFGYLFQGEELGARPRDPSCYVNGRVQYRTVARLPAFRAGIDRVLSEARTNRVALLCAEREPLACHRALLVARELEARDAAVVHILADGTLEPHADAMQRLLTQLKLRQLDLFGARSDLLDLAYATQEERIAFSRDDAGSGYDHEGAGMP